MNYYKAEWIKQKRSSIVRIVIMAPVVTAVFALLISGTRIFQQACIYWWYSFVIQGFIATLCYVGVRKEEVSGNQMMLFSLPVNIRAVRESKIAVIATKLLFANLILALLIAGASIYFFPSSMRVGIIKLIIAAIIIACTTMWQIPLCFLIGRYIGALLPIAINLLAGVFLTPLIGNTKYWMICPYTWPAKEMEWLLNIGINGVPMDDRTVLSPNNVIVLVMAGILFLVLSKEESRIYSKVRL